MATKRETPEEKLDKYLYTMRPIVYIHHFDFQTVDRMIGTAGKKAMREKLCVIDVYSEAGGRIHFETKSPVRPGAPMPLEEFLARYNTTQFNDDPKNYLLVLKEVHDRLAEPRVVSLLQTLAQRTKEAADSPKDENGRRNRYRVQVVIVDTQLAIPPSLEKLTTVIEIPPPDAWRIGKIVRDVVDHSPGLKLDEDFERELAGAFAGLPEFDIRQILALAAHEAFKTPEKKLDRKVLSLINEEKRQIIRKSGLLEFIDTAAKDAGDGKPPEEDDDGSRDVGGLRKLRDFVKKNREAFKNPLAQDFGVDPPAGVMIVGMPGCGKSLMAKTIARVFGVPLLKLDVGRLLGKYVGESENNLHRAMEVAETVAPCVLWIDEIEKAFAGIGDDGGGGAMRRMFGIFLTWMQEKTARIYVVATANNLEKLPPEFKRRGRFDEIFQVGFPNAEERREILEVHVRKRNHGAVPPGVDLDTAAGKFRDNDTEKYSGADIESIVKEAMKRVFTENMEGYRKAKEKRVDLTLEKYRAQKGNWKELTTEVLVKVIGTTHSSYHSQKEDLDKMKDALGKLNAKRAS